MKTITLTLLLTFVSFGLFSQDFKIPLNVKLEKAEDYAKYEQDVLNGINWLITTPISEHTDKRKEVNAFLLKWLIGSPNVVIDLNEEIVTFLGTSPELLMIFMGGWTKHVLETGDFNNKLAGNLNGIEYVIDFYNMNRATMSKDKNVEKFIKMKKKGTLKNYVEKNI